LAEIHTQESPPTSLKKGLKGDEIPISLHIHSAHGGGSAQAILQVFVFLRSLENGTNIGIKK
jgi:hypothetical protein